MGTNASERTLEEEIRLLAIPEEIKDHLPLKISSIGEKFNKDLLESKLEGESKASAEYGKLEQMREQNISLKSACFALAAALKQEYEL